MRCLRRALAYERDKPVTIEAGGDWVPLKTELDIEPGSALDLSGLGFAQGPCGAKGRVIATPEGHFAFEKEPGKPVRFYGVNLCFSAQYMPKAAVDTMLDRFVRLGYNTVRIHHYEPVLNEPAWDPGFNWSKERLDQIDYLMAGCAKRGLWITTDFFVFRQISWRQIGVDRDGKVDTGLYKQLVHVNVGCGL